MSTDDAVSISYKDLVATIEIRREAQLNALSSEVLGGLSAAIAELEKQCRGPQAYERVRVVLLRGAGEKAFVAGADIKQMKSASPAELREFTALGQRVMRELESLPLPVIAVVHGFALGGGLELALAADIIVASTKAKLGQPEVKLGLIPGFGGTQRLIARTGIGRAKKLIYTGDDVTAEEAYALGIVDILSAPEELEAAVSKLTYAITARSPLAVAAAKRAIEEHTAPAKIPGLRREAEEFLALFQTKDAAEGLDAFVSKRKPNFTGQQ